MGLKPPHLLLASSNPNKMLVNLKHILDVAACTAIQNEINTNAKLLFELGESHYSFAKNLLKQHWRQRTSRFYYGAYNVRRAISLHEDGSFNVNVDDHKNTKLPDTMHNSSLYMNQLHVLRADRNLADYEHTAVETDLVLTQDEAEMLVSNFLGDARSYLIERGLDL